jgi:hypothetical protein
MAVFLSPVGGVAAQFFSNNGVPLSGGKLYTYAAGTTTPATTYTSSNGLIAWSNPIVLDAAGRVSGSGEIWLTQNITYKFVLKDSNDVLIGTYDNIVAINDVNASTINYTPAGTGAVTTTVQDKLRQYVSVKDFGAIGNGVANDTAAIQAAINTGQLFIDLVGGNYSLTTKLTFSQAGQTFQNGTLLFNGDNTQRIGDITADNVTFVNVTFNGNDKQPRSAAIWINDNVQRPKFQSCTFKNLTGKNWGSSALNAMYAVLISPYGVLNFEFRDCLFQNLIKYNDGINTIPVTPAFIGGGFVGAVCFLTENLNPGTTAQTVVTQGTIEGCIFDNIQTIRAAGLSIGDQTEFNDADAIRTYGDANTPELFVHVSDCVFKNVSKRCFKFQASGSTAYDNECYASDLPYGMTSPIDLTSNTKVMNLKVFASVARPVLNGITWSVGIVYNRESLVEGFYVSHATNGMNFFSDTSFNVLRNFTLRNCYFNQVYSVGIVSSAPVATDYENIVVENVQIFGGATTTIGIQTIAGSTSKSAGLTLRNVFLSNCNLNCGGIDNTISNVTLEISLNTWVGATTTTQLYRIGENGYGGFQNVSNVFINAYNINTGFLTATRPTLGILIGDNGTFSNIRLKVPETLSVTYAHGEIYGSEMNVDGLQYDGPGRINFGTTSPLIRGTIQNAVRMSSNGGACTESFLYTSNASTTQVALMNVTDLRPTTASSIIINNGTEFIVYNVASKTSNGTIVLNGGLAKTANINTF